MKKSGCAAAMLLAVLLVAGCSGTKTRPAAPGVTRSYGHASTGSTGSSDAGSTPFNDDISRSQDSRYRDSSDSVPGGPPPDISKLVEPVPKVEPRSLYGNKFHGYKTSSLETYDMYAFTAASKTLPLPSYARVTNLQSGQSVVVRINDRGPFHEDRVIDLSYAAAVKIGIWPKGTGLVEVRGIDPGEPESELPPPAVVTSEHPGIYLQVGAFSDADNAERVAQRLRQAGLGTVQVTDAEINGQHVRRVRVGPLADVNSADQVSARIEGMGLPRPQVAVD